MAGTVWDAASASAQVTLSNGALTASNESAGNGGVLRATKSLSASKRYFEIFVDNGTSNSSTYQGVGVARATAPNTNYLGATTNSWGYWGSGDRYTNGQRTSGYPTYQTGDVVMVAVDIDAGKLWFGKNGVWQGSPADGTGAAYSGVSGAIYPAIDVRFNGRVLTGRFAPAALSYTSPAGFIYWDPLIISGTVEVGSPPLAAIRTVTLLSLSAGAVVGQGSSGEDGAYEIETNARIGDAIYGVASPDYGEPWIASHVYVVGDRTWIGEPAPLGHWYECEQAGTTGSTEPTWPTDGSTVTDGTVIWRDKGVMERPWAEGPYLAEAA